MSVKDTKEVVKPEVKTIKISGVVINEVQQAIEAGLFKKESVEQYVNAEVVRGSIGSVIKAGLVDKIKEANLVEVANTFQNKENEEEYTEDEKKYIEIYDAFMGSDHDVIFPVWLDRAHLALNIAPNAELTRSVALFLLQIFNDFKQS